MTRTLLLPLLLVTACTLNGDEYPRPRDLPSSTLVDRPRVLAIRAEPPELAPGERAVMSALLADPTGEIDLQLWLACPPERSSSFGCLVDLSVLDGEPTPEELAAAGVIGFVPGLPPVLDVPATALDAVPEEDREDGIYWTAQVMGFPEAALSGDEVDFNSVESAYKRVVVSTQASPNQNPDVAGLRVDDLLLPAQATLEVDAGASYALSVVLADDAVETYDYVTPDGVAELREEAPFVLWYATGGEWYNGTALYPALSDFWTAPNEPGAEGTLWAVVRDRRGGMGWWAQPWRVVEGG